MGSGIKIFAPATVANVACGFDILGFALHHVGDEIIVKKSASKGLKISKIIGDKNKLPLEIEKNTAGWAAFKLLEYLGETDNGIDFEIHKKMPFGSGLGSSAASAVAGVMAINAFLKNPLEKKELLRFAIDGESIASGARHADNVAPSLLGGMMLIRDSSDKPDVHRIPLPKGMYATVVHPHINILTKEARSLLSPTVTLKQHIQQSGNLAGLIVGFFNADFDLIQKSMTDVIIEEQRAPLIPGFYDAKEAALKCGALGCSISGSGPSIFAFTNNSLVAENIGEEFKKVYTSLKIPHNIYISPINNEGAVIL
ncbi:MAG: homoserine kinase [Saprospiraceae bacterium]|nr:homoserine kinase [Saprospiraceae bacterium]